MDVPSVIARQESLWVLEKPSGWAVHPTGEDGDLDLMTWASTSLTFEGTMSPAHRLDRETSGLVLCSPSGEVRSEVGRWFADGSVSKVYLALVHGRARYKGIIRKPLSDSRRGRPLEAVTRYKCVARYGGVSLLRVRPETGRRHQIRRHLQGIGHALVGDERYTPPRFRPVPGFPGRLWLHAHRLALPNGQIYQSPLPTSLADHLTLLEDRGKGATSKDKPE